MRDNKSCKPFHFTTLQLTICLDDQVSKLVVTCVQRQVDTASTRLPTVPEDKMSKKWWSPYLRKTTLGIHTFVRRGASGNKCVFLAIRKARDASSRDRVHKVVETSDEAHSEAMVSQCSIQHGTQLLVYMKNTGKPIRTPARPRMRATLRYPHTRRTQRHQGQV